MRKLDYGTPLMELFEEWTYTFSRLQAHPVARPLAAPFVPLEGRWKETLQREIDLIRQRALARAQVTVADVLLDGFLEDFDLVLLKAVGNDRTADLYQRFFGGKRPSDLKRPVLGEQLEAMAGWVPTLAGLSSEPLRAQAETLRPLVEQGRAAESALRLAVQAVEDFYALKEHKELVDQLNAVRHRVLGQLNELRHSHPELNLPRDFAEQFFLREERSRGPTLASERRTIERLEQQLVRHRQILAELEAEASARAQQEVAEDEAEKELRALEEQKRAVAEREAELRKQIGRKRR